MFIFRLTAIINQVSIQTSTAHASGSDKNKRLLMEEKHDKNTTYTATASI